MPTPFTVRAGNLALIAAGAWIVAVLLIGLSTWFDPDGWLPLYLAIMAFVTVAGTLGLVAMMALGTRMGGFSTIGTIGLVVVGIGVVVAFAMTWALPLWMPIQGLGFLMIGLASTRSPEVPRSGVIALGSGFVTGSIVFFIANVAEVGWSDSWGDHPVAWFLGVGVGSVIVALGLVIVGRWLAGEEPVCADSTPVAA